MLTILRCDEGRINRTGDWQRKQRVKRSADDESLFCFSGDCDKEFPHHAMCRRDGRPTGADVRRKRSSAIKTAQPRSDPVPARHRSLHSSRFVRWLRGLVIQLKRGGLIVRKGLAKLPIALVATLGTILRWCVGTGQSLWRLVRVCRLQLRRAILRGRMFFQKRSAWTLAGVTGTLGILLMILLQLMYSFQTLRAKESGSPHIAQSERNIKTPADTRIDPGLPQGWLKVTAYRPIAQLDPFVPEETETEPAPFAADPVDADRRPSPNQNRNPNPKTQLLPPVKPEPFVDPLDNFPPASEAPMRSEPPTEPPPAVNAEPQEFSPQNPLPIKPQPQTEAPAAPFVDPLNALPPASPIPEPAKPMPANNEPEPFGDPLDTLPPASPVPFGEESKPEPPVGPVPMQTAAPPSEVPLAPAVEMGLELRRLPADDDERFLEKSAQPFSRENVSRENSRRRLGPACRDRSPG